MRSRLILALALAFERAAKTGEFLHYAKIEVAARKLLSKEEIEEWEKLVCDF